MRIKCTHCSIEFELPGQNWVDSVACPECKQEILLPRAETVKYGATDIPQLSPPGGQQRPTTLRDEEVFAQGTMIGPYEIESFIGRGGMGSVYRAKHTMLGRAVAIKVLPAKFAKDPEFVHRFRREAQALANLAHPNIVAVHDLGVQGEIYYFAMEFVDGVNMRDVLAHKKLSPEDALKVVPQLCEALEYAHSQGIIHRDIKPENILMDKSGHAKIADFGLAKIVKGDETAVPLTQTNVVMGTVDYMAPEQRDNLKQVDHRADIYSLGVVLYEMLTGQLPVGKFDPPSKNLRIDVRIDDVVLKALEREPDRRYQRASHMGTDVSKVTMSAPGAVGGQIPVTNLKRMKPIGTSSGRSLGIRSADSTVEVVGWGKPEIGIETDGNFLFEREVIQATGDPTRLRVFVPRGLEIDVVSPNGRVELKQTECKATLKVAEGQVNVVHHDGPLAVTVQSGRVDAHHVRSDDLDIRAGSGEIFLGLLRLVRGRANVEAQNGNIRIQLDPESSVRYTLQSVSGQVRCPCASSSPGLAAGTCGEGAATLYARTSSGEIHVDHCFVDTVITTVESVSVPRKLTRKQLEKIGVYVIVNTALFLFFGIVAGNVTAPVIIAIFWGMGLAINLWRSHVGGEPEAPRARAVVAEAPAKPTRSTLAIVGFLLAVMALLGGGAATIVHFIERNAESLEIRTSELQEMRTAVVANAWAATILGAIAFCLCIAASSHVWRSKGALRGRAWAGAGIVMSAAPFFLLVGAVSPTYSALRSDTEQVRRRAEEFGLFVRDGRWDEAYLMLSEETKGRIAPEEFRREGPRMRDLANYTNLRARDVVVLPSGERAVFRFDRDESFRFSAVKERDGWRISDPIPPRSKEDDRKRRDSD